MLFYVGTLTNTLSAPIRGVGGILRGGPLDSMSGRLIEIQYIPFILPLADGQVHHPALCPSQDTIFCILDDSQLKTTCGDLTPGLRIPEPERQERIIEARQYQLAIPML